MLGELRGDWTPRAAWPTPRPRRRCPAPGQAGGSPPASRDHRGCYRLGRPSALARQCGRLRVGRRFPFGDWSVGGA
eukprot:1495583-Pyramimonas_sp.AAC.1